MGLPAVVNPRAVDPSVLEAAVRANPMFGGSGGGGRPPTRPPVTTPPHEPAPAPIDVTPRPITKRVFEHDPVLDASLAAKAAAGRAEANATAEASRRSVESMANAMIVETKRTGNVAKLRSFLNKLNPVAVAIIMGGSLVADLWYLGIGSDPSQPSTSGGTSTGPSNSSGGGVGGGVIALPNPNDLPALPDFGGGTIGTGTNDSPTPLLGVTIGMVTQVGPSTYRVTMPEAQFSNRAKALSPGVIVQPVEVICTNETRRHIAQLCAPYGGMNRVAQLLYILKTGLTPEILVALEGL